MIGRKLLSFTKFIYVLFIIGTITSIFIVYKNIANGIAVKFVIGYVFLSFFMLLYIPFVTILNSKSLKWVEIRKRLFKFISLFILFGALNYVFDYILRPSHINLAKELSIAFGLAIGGSFTDILFLEKNKLD